MLAELRCEPEAMQELQMIYIEEFLLVQRGRVGFLLPFHTRKLWLDQGARWSAPHTHFLTLQLELNHVQYAYTCVYIPSGHTVDQRQDRAMAYSKAHEHHQQLEKDDPALLQVWGGDWNGHVGRDHHQTEHRPTWALKTPTAASGIEQRQWLSTTDLQCVDQFFRCGHRGTWQHPGNKKWYELDYFCASTAILKQTQTIRTLCLGISDHSAKQMLFHVPHPLSKQSKRSAKAKRIAQATAPPTARVQYELLRGPSTAARRNRGLF